MTIRRRVTANYNSRRRMTARISNESANFSDRVEISTYELPVERTLEPISDLVAQSSSMEIRSCGAEPPARLLDARSRAERIRKEHVQYDEYGSARCLLCGFSYPCDAVSAAEDLLDLAHASPDAESSREFPAPPN